MRPLKCFKFMVFWDMLPKTRDDFLSQWIAVADPGFSRGVGAILPWRVPTYDFAKFSQNCMKLKEFGPPGGHAFLAPPLRSANVLGNFGKIICWCAPPPPRVGALTQEILDPPLHEIKRILTLTPPPFRSVNGLAPFRIGNPESAPECFV